MRSIHNILVTGGAGFIGSHLVQHLVTKYPNYNVVNFDKLTYAGNLENIKSVERASNYTFIKGDILDAQAVTDCMSKHNIDTVVHLAAESHVDRSIEDPNSFLTTNILGTANLLNAFRTRFENGDATLFYHISTDEVFGSLGTEGLFTETTRYDPRSPYSASKAASDHLVSAYHHTYKLPVILSNCSNNYGPNQFPEKLLPLIINNIVEQKPLPIYGDGLNVRDWLYVQDHIEAMDLLIHEAAIGENYNIGGNAEVTNIDFVKMVCNIMDTSLGRCEGESENLITYVTDRKGHDRRYAIDTTKIKTQLNWQASVSLHEGLKKTVNWYLENSDWLENVKTKEYQNYYKKQYSK